MGSAILPVPVLHWILKKCNILKKEGQLHLLLEGNAACDFSTGSVLPFGQFLTHLCIHNYSVKENEMMALSNAMRNEELPRLSHLNFISLRKGDKFKWPFKSAWSNLSHLNLSWCEFDRNNLQSLNKKWGPKTTYQT